MGGKDEIRVRFAPSPTGYLHIGNARTALLNFLFARQGGGRFFLRIDDTDKARSGEDYVRAIKEDLRWLGIVADETARQSERMALYDRAAETLKERGFLYPCYETEEELALKRRALIAAKKPPIYDRAALKLSSAERAASERAGRASYWRFRLSGEVRFVKDLIAGEIRVDLASQSDPVLIRRDGRFLYHLPSVVDDMDMGISHVIRGEDHLTNSAAHCEIAEALGGAPPFFGHHGLIADSSGRSFSKRMGDASLRSLREEGVEAEALRRFLSGFGGDGGDGGLFRLGSVSGGVLRFDRRRLAALSESVVRGMSYEAARPRLAALGVGGGAAFWDVVSGNLASMADAVLWWRVVSGEVELVVSDGDLDFVAVAARLLPSPPWGEGVWGDWTARVGMETGRRGRGLFLPLRLALTGLAEGPDMARLVLLMGHDRVRLCLERACSR